MPGPYSLPMSYGPDIPDYFARLLATPHGAKAADLRQHRLRSAKRVLGIDDPLGLAQRGQ
jgi:hypothetical protein